MAGYRYKDDDIIKAVAESNSIAGALRKLGARISGGQYSNLKRHIERLGLDTSHFTGQGHMRGKNPGNRKSANEILVLLPAGSCRTTVSRLRRSLLEVGVEEKCVGCGLLPEWRGELLRLEIDHINEDWLDNRQENLQFLCPNCHSQKTASTRGGTVDTAV